MREPSLELGSIPNTTRTSGDLTAKEQVVGRVQHLWVELLGGDLKSGGILAELTQ